MPRIWVTALVKAQTTWEARLDTAVAVTATIVADKLVGPRSPSSRSDHLLALVSDPRLEQAAQVKNSHAAFRAMVVVRVLGQAGGASLSEARARCRLCGIWNALHVNKRKNDRVDGCAAGRQPLLCVKCVPRAAGLRGGQRPQLGPPRPSRPHDVGPARRPATGRRTRRPFRVSEFAVIEAAPAP